MTERIIVKGGFNPSLLPDGEEVEPRRGGRFVVKLPAGASARRYADLLDSQDDVEYAEPDRRGSGHIVPDDTRYGEQWALQTINIEAAWDVTLGDDSTLIGVVDSGVALTTGGVMDHPDMAEGAWWIRGTDYVADDSVPRDEHGHGTHVAGVIFADTDNAEGIAGITVYSDVYVTRVLDDTNSGFVSDFVDGVEEVVAYFQANAYDHCVINFSIGLDGGPSTALEDAMQAASDADVLVVCSAGNNSSSVGYPAAHSTEIANLMAIGATTSAGSVASYSNTGPEISMVAPGSGILSTVPPYSVNGTSTLNYDSWNGTSMAVPHVVAVASLMWDVFPSYTATQIRSKLEDSANPLGAGTFSNNWGNGELDAEAAVSTPAIGGDVTVDYTVDDASYILNPGIGWQWQSASSGDPDETVSYRRSTVGEFFWDELNPSDGGYSWSRIDSALSTAASQGKQVHFRVIQERGEGFGGHKVPQWVINKDSQVVNPPAGGGLVRYSRRTYQVEWAKFINAVRNRYDDDDRVAAIDISGYGNFGEYTYFDNHVLDNSPSSPGDLDGYCRRMLMHLFVGGSSSNHQDSGGTRSYNYPGFQNTQLIQPDAGIRHHTAMVLEYSDDVGARTDILGNGSLWDDRDLGGEFPSGTSCKDLVVARYTTAPVAYEMAGNATANSSNANTALKETHGSLVHENGNNGSASAVRNMMRRCGYRIRPVQIVYPGSAPAGYAIELTGTWRNHGYAPPYRRMGQDFQLKFGLRKSNGAMQHEWTLAEDPCDWMPAVNVDNSAPNISVSEQVTIPGGTPAATYTLTVGVYDNRTGDFINLATTTGAESDGRIDVGSLTVTAEDPDPEEYNITPASTAHAQAVTQPSVQHLISLVFDSTTHGHSAGEPFNYGSETVLVDDSDHAHESTQPGLTTLVDLLINSARMAMTSTLPYTGDEAPSFTPPRVDAQWPWHLRTWRLWRWLDPIQVGLTVWQTAEGDWRSGFPTVDDLASAQTVYLGGRTYELTDEQATELEDNGYEVDRPS